MKRTSQTDKTALQNLFNVISLAVLTRFATAYGSEAVSAMGIANKVYLVPLYTAMGIALGLSPSSAITIRAAIPSV